MMNRSLLSPRDLNLASFVGHMNNKNLSQIKETPYKRKRKEEEKALISFYRKVIHRIALWLR